MTCINSVCHILVEFNVSIVKFLFFKLTNLMAFRKWIYVCQIKRQLTPLKFSSHLPHPQVTPIMSFHTWDWFLLYWDFALMRSYAVFGINMISVGFMCIAVSGWSFLSFSLTCSFPLCGKNHNLSLLFWWTFY